MAEWYYFQGGNQQGPVGDDQLRGMVAGGQLQPSDSVWKQGMANWAPISSIPELMPAMGGQRGPAPMPGPGPGPGPAPAYGDDYGYAPRRPAAPGGVKKVTIWAILLVAGGGLWFINAFMPWWSMSLTVEGIEKTDDNMKAAKKAGEIMRENNDWYNSHVGMNNMKKMAAVFSPTDPTSRAKATLLGIHTGTGLFAFIMSFLLLGAVITSFFVTIMAAWRWPASFLFAVFGLIFLILSMLWLFGAPGADAPPILSQGIIIGPIISLIASLLVLGGGVLDGLFGLFDFLARLKNRPAPAAPSGPGPAY